MPATIILIAIGIFTFYGGIKKPGFFWENRRSVRLRNLFGDNAVAIFYSILGIIIVILGILNIFQEFI